MGRSNLRAKDSVGGYNIVTIGSGQATYQERNPGVGTQPAWATIPLVNHHFASERRYYDRPSYDANTRHVAVREVWRSEEHTSELQSLMRISYAVFCLQK